MLGIITLLAVPLLGDTSPAPRAPAPEDSAAMTLVVVENDRRARSTSRRIIDIERGTHIGLFIPER